MLNIVLLLAVLATLLVVVAVSQPVAVRLKVAPVVLLAVIGVAIGGASAVLLHTPVGERFGNVAKASDQVNLTVPPPPGTGNGQQFSVHQTFLWAQGITLGAELHF